MRTSTQTQTRSPARSAFALYIIAFAVLCSATACHKKQEASSDAAPAAMSASGAATRTVNAATHTATDTATHAATDSAASSKALPQGKAEAASPSDTVLNASGTRVSPTQQLGSSALTATPQGRQLLRTGALRLTVKDVYQANLAIEDALAAHGGYVVQSTIESQIGQQASYPAAHGMTQQVAQIQISGDLTLRLPSGKASAFLRSIASHIQTIESRTLAANDVQFDLLRQQLDAARAQATAQALAQLAQQAGRIADKNQTLAQRRQAQIEANEAQLAQRMLADQVDFATLTLNLVQDPFVRTRTVVDFEAAKQQHQPSFLTSAASAAARGWAGFLAFIVDLVSAWPLLLIGVAALLVWQRNRARRAQHNNEH